MIYAIQCGENGPIKLGRAEDPYKRMKHLQTSNPFNLSMLACEETLDDEEAEKQLHIQLRMYRIRGEWFRPEKAVLDTVALMRRNLAQVKYILDRAAVYEKMHKDQSGRRDMINLLQALRRYDQIQKDKVNGSAEPVHQS